MHLNNSELEGVVHRGKGKEEVGLLGPVVVSYGVGWGMIRGVGLEHRTRWGVRLGTEEVGMVGGRVGQVRRVGEGVGIGEVFESDRGRYA
jgi:hypothetical protein